jgi:hypothetical protein
MKTADEPGFDLDHLLHPAKAFRRPQDVVRDGDLTVNEKRTILAAWASDACASSASDACASSASDACASSASDACAAEASPALHCPPGAGDPVSVDEILEALRSLDEVANAARAPSQSSAWRRRQARRQSIESYRQRRGSGGVDGGPPQ